MKRQLPAIRSKNLLSRPKRALLMPLAIGTGGVLVGVLTVMALKSFGPPLVRYLKIEQM